VSASFEIRAVTRDDVAGVLMLVREVLAEHGLEFGAGSPTDDALRGLPEAYTAQGGAFWVVSHRDAVVGTCGVARVDAETFELRKMYLSPVTRGQGLGRALLERAIDHARAARAKRVVLDTTEQMQRAIALYEANGFVRDDRYITAARCSRGYVRMLDRA
jgi:putative acetyltransferase